MIYFFYGDNSEEKRKACDKLMESLSSADTTLFSMNDIDFEPGEFEEHIWGSGLFSSQNVILLENVFGNKEIEDFLFKRLEDIKESNNVFIFLERDVSRKVRDRLKKVSEKAELFELAKLSPQRTFNIFLLTDAFGGRDKKKAWIFYQKALDSGMASEEIANILFWQLKTILLVKGKSSNPGVMQKTGLKPFVFKKALSFSNNFSKDELETLSSKFTSLYNESRRTSRDLAIDLERFILEI